MGLNIIFPILDSLFCGNLVILFWSWFINNEFALGIPFFCIKYEIVVSVEDKFVFLGSQKWKNTTLN